MEVELTIKNKYDVHYLKVDAGVRYWNDSDVNGEEDIDFYYTEGVGVPKMPCAVQVKDKPESNIYSDHYRWQPIIDINTGQIINWKQGVSAFVHYKVCDEGEYTLLDKDKNEIVSIQSYVPYVLYPEDEGYGDYIIMSIDENGFIKKWKCDSNAIEYLVKSAFD
jgi:phage protein